MTVEGVVSQIATSGGTKRCYYALWEARRYAKLQESALASQHFTSRQQFKYRHLAKWWYPWFYFGFTYLAKLGFLDGGAGFHYAAYKAWYFQTIRLLIQENASHSTTANNTSRS